jgi:Protein of unknown function (DUF2878)
VRIAINVVIIYAAWFATVQAAAAGRPWSAAAASIAVLAINITLARRRSAEVTLIFAAALVGLVVDGILIATGFAIYAAPGPISGFPPAWLVLMWMAFATMLNVSLAWLKDRLALAAVLGFIGGPLSYYAGAQLGAVQFSQPIWLGLGAVGGLWAIALPSLLYLAHSTDSTDHSMRQ